jgi:hypothetical protein
MPYSLFSPLPHLTPRGRLSKPHPGSSRNERSAGVDSRVDSSRPGGGCGVQVRRPQAGLSHGHASPNVCRPCILIGPNHALRKIPVSGVSYAAPALDRSLFGAFTSAGVRDGFSRQRNLSATRHALGGRLGAAGRIPHSEPLGSDPWIGADEDQEDVCTSSEVRSAIRRGTILKERCAPVGE